MTDKLIPSFETELKLEESFTNFSIEESNQSSSNPTITPTRPSSPGSSSKLRKRIKELEKQVESLNKELKKYKDEYGENITINDTQNDKLVKKFIDNSPYLIKESKLINSRNLKIYSTNELIKRLKQNNQGAEWFLIYFFQLKDGNNILLNFSCSDKALELFYPLSQDKQKLEKEIDEFFNGKVDITGYKKMLRNQVSEKTPKESFIKAIGSLEWVYKNDNYGNLGYNLTSVGWPRSYETLSNLYDQYLKEVLEEK